MKAIEDAKKRSKQDTDQKLQELDAFLVRVATIIKSSEHFLPKARVTQ